MVKNFLQSLCLMLWLASCTVAYLLLSVDACHEVYVLHCCFCLSIRGLAVDSTAFGCEICWC